MHCNLYSQREFYKLFASLMAPCTPITSPRGLKTREQLNVSYTLAPFVRFCTVPARKYSMKYLKREWSWYVKADPYDLSILDHAKAWTPMVKDGRINSNYGAYWFHKDHGVDMVVKTLQQDPDSRRAVIPMYGIIPEHTEEGVRDVPCTLNAQFLMRKNPNGFKELYSRFTMRSQDAIYGMGNDIPTFSFLSEMIADLLGIYLGPMTVSVGSFHIYEPFFDVGSVIGSTTMENCPEHLPDEPPGMEREDALWALGNDICPTTPFGKWLLSEE